MFVEISLGAGRGGDTTVGAREGHGGLASRATSASHSVPHAAPTRAHSRILLRARSFKSRLLTQCFQNSHSRLIPVYSVQNHSHRCGECLTTPLVYTPRLAIVRQSVRSVKCAATHLSPEAPELTTNYLPSFTYCMVEPARNFWLHGSIFPDWSGCGRDRDDREALCFLLSRGGRKMPRGPFTSWRPLWKFRSKAPSISCLPLGVSRNGWQMAWLFGLFV
ncbi:hypothetical protein E2C01_053847 [Portunus trituberculatus]|uniref:Uncharacterized protein n=1 Tax=Portunus trituberculatus TaxID=210409 RepID=A0A5B7GRK4_PORTR|nr:hypothetical protein [Portunus trituberculatus]